MPQVHRRPTTSPDAIDHEAPRSRGRSSRLTDRQAEVLGIIFDLQREQGYPPTFKEIAERIELTPSTVQKHVDRLIRKGSLYRHGDGMRTLQIVDAQFLRDHGDGYPDRGCVNQGEELSTGIDAPLVTVDDVVSAPPGCFLVRVAGSSLAAAGISDQDMLVVNPKRIPTNGDLVVAEPIDGGAVVREYHGQRGKITLLVPGDRKRSASVDHSAIIGVVVSMLRSFV